MIREISGQPFENGGEYVISQPLAASSASTCKALGLVGCCWPAAHVNAAIPHRPPSIRRNNKGLLKEITEPR